MTAVTLERFCEFFKAVHGYAPYPWQDRLAQRAVNGDWPGAIDLPTGSGKTASIDIAVFAMACQASLPVAQRRAPCRVFFCVNRRVIVDEAYQRARHLAEALWRAEQDDDAATILRDIAAALRSRVGGTNGRDNIPPLDVLELRGGIYRDNRWTRSIAQPSVVCTTLDQLGSRLLFRGYGVSPNAAPIQAALIAYDSLILLDEAHISEPFRQTLESVRAYLESGNWAEQDIGVRPVTVVPMTATPPQDMSEDQVINLKDDDRDPQFPLLSRLTAPKPAELRQVSDVAKEAVTIAKSFDRDTPVAVGVIVNRVATAKKIYDDLCELQAEPNDKKRKVPLDATIELVIGSMRPIDREKQAERLRRIVGPNRPKSASMQTSFVIATQCLEVGADYDFDVLLTECASLDALRQRFGRLNRAGRGIEAQGVILVDKKAVKTADEIEKVEAANEPRKRHLDPIYGNALARTWNWLNQHSTNETDGDKSFQVIDFCVDAFDPLLQQLRANVEEYKSLLAPSSKANAPVMLPAYVDCWCQTTPHPVPDPDVSLFIHGERRGEPDVQVCWRADLVEDEHLNRSHWCDVVALLPPTSAECMSVSISRLRRWLADQMDKVEDHGDVLGATASDESDAKNGDTGAQPPVRYGVLWRGTKDSTVIQSPDDVRPGDTFVLPTSAGGWNELGYIPDLRSPLTRDATVEDRLAVQGAPTSADSMDIGAPAGLSDADKDVAEIAFRTARDRAALRLHPSLRSRLPALGDLVARATDVDEPPTVSEWRNLLASAADSIAGEQSEIEERLRYLADANMGLTCERYVDGRGIVLTTRRRIGATFAWCQQPLDEGDDGASRTQREQPVLLSDHTNHVVATLDEAMTQLPLDTLSGPLSTAAQLHDIGKADDRFQAMLRRTSRTDAWLLAGAAALAKSDGFPVSRSDRDAARRRAALPAGFRHEMLSVQIATSYNQLPSNSAERELVLHLIAAHHGYARPFAPVVLDEEPPAVEVDGMTLSNNEREALIPPHRLDSGVAERFWSLTRRFGWWGLAYLDESADSMDVAEVAL